MLLVGTCSASGRRVVGSAVGRLPRHVALHSKSRLLVSSPLQRAALPSFQNGPYAFPSSSRSFWWSSSKSTPANSTPAAAASVVATSTEPVPPTTVPPAETVTVIDPAQAADAATAASTTDVVSQTPVDAVVNAVSSVPAPLNYGDLAALGLAGWSPAGLCRWGMESLQVFTGMPWFWTIVTATLLTRVVLFPFNVISLRNSAKLAPHQEEFNALREEIMKAQRSKDPLSMQKAVLKQRMLYEKIGVSMPSMALAPFVQLPVTLGMFFGVKTLCDFPLEQLKFSGLSYLPDLIAIDPTHILPVVAAALMNLQLTVGARDMSSTPQSAHLINLFRGLSVLGVFFMMNLPSGVLVYLITSIGAMTVQTLLLRVPAIRRMLGIPVLPPGAGTKPATMMESIEFAKKWWKDKKAEQEAIIRASRR